MLRSPFPYLLSLALLTSVAPPSQAQSVQFECAVDEGNIPTTYAQTEGGIVQIFKWKSAFFNPPYTPMQRCQEVSLRLNQFKPDHLVAGKVNNYNVICAGTQCDPRGSNILLTLRPDQNPAQVLAEIDNTRDAAGGPSMQLGGGNRRTTTSESYLTKNKTGEAVLNLKGFIQSAPKMPLNSVGQSPAPPAAPSLTSEPITAPAQTGKPAGSSRGSVW